VALSANVEYLEKIAYGVAVNGWRGVSTTNGPPPFVCTAISSQVAPPRKAPALKSSVVVNNPLLMATAGLVNTTLV
jgi:hypothetical protein